MNKADSERLGTALEQLGLHPVDRADEAEALSRRLRELVEKGEITGEEARKRYKKAFPQK